MADPTNLGTFDGLGNFIPDNLETPDSSAQMVNLILTRVFGFLTIVAGLSFLIYFIIGGLNWVTAGGDSKKVDDAKHYMTNGAIGMIVIIVAYAVVWIIGKALGLDILNPGQTFVTMFNP